MSVSHITTRCAVVALAAAAVAACSGVPSGVIQPSDMADLMVDIHIGEAVAEQNRSQFPNDSMKQLFKQSIYARHGVTAEEFDSSMQWYGHHVDRYAEIYDEVEKRLEEKIAKASELSASGAESQPVMASFEADGDSVDVWASYRSRMMNPNFSTDRITFELKNDRYWEKGDVYCLRFKALDAPGQFEVSLAGEYSNGAVDYASANRRESGWHEVYLHLSDSLNASSVYGAIAYSDGVPHRPHQLVEARVDSISLVRMRKSNGSRKPRNQHRFGPLRL